MLNIYTFALKGSKHKMATRITFKAGNHLNMEPESMTDDLRHPIESHQAAEPFSSFPESIKKDERYISVTSPFDSRSTSPNLNDLLANRESASSVFTKRNDEEVIPQHSLVNSGFASQLAQESSKIDKLEEHSVDYLHGADENEVHDDDNSETTSMSSNSSPNASSPPPASSKLTPLSEYNNFKKKRPGPLGKRALLKKLSEGTLVRRQSERHHQTTGPISPNNEYSPQMFSARQPKVPEISNSVLSKRKSANLFKKNFPQPIELLDLDALRRYRNAYKLSIRPTASRSSLLRVVVDHYSKMDPDPTQIISRFICALHSDRNCK